MRHTQRFTCVLLLLISSFSLHLLNAEEGFERIFNGKDLTDWDALPGGEGLYIVLPVL